MVLIPGCTSESPVQFVFASLNTDIQLLPTRDSDSVALGRGSGSILLKSYIALSSAHLGLRLYSLLQPCMVCFKFLYLNYEYILG